jgi:hypothetical protein
MEFAFGAPLGLDCLFGLDDAGQPVEAMSIGHYVRHTHKHRSPVPDFLWDAGTWPPEFFRLVAMKLHEEGLQPLVIAIASYLDAEADHLDGAYLKAHVGLEAFAKKLLSQNTPDLLVQDK